jgi:hypothetical protein
MTRFWSAWPSWAVELSGGLLLGLVCGGVPGTLVSLGYELLVDHNGWSWADAAQRQCGVVAGSALRLVLCGAS